MCASPPPLLSAKRLSSVDLLKGIGIFLVVMGHCPDEWNLHHWIYAFHMPLFAFVGGLFLKSQPFRKFAVKKITRLLVPFFVWSLFFWVLYDVVIYFCEPRLLGAQLKQIVYIAIGSGQNAVKGYANVALWFLPFLFSASMIYFIMAKLSERKWVEYAGVVFVAALGLICGLLELRLPYKLNTAFTLYPFLWAGTKYFRLIQSVQLHTWGRWAAMIICLCIYVPCTLFNTRVDTASNVVGNFALFLSGGICCNHFLCHNLPDGRQYRICEFYGPEQPCNIDIPHADHTTNIVFGRNIYDLCNVIVAPYCSRYIMCSCNLFH